MKKIVLIQSFFFAFAAIGLAQQYLPFAPVGATYYYVSFYCPNTGWPPQGYHQYTISKDSVINGKYCTEIFSTWPCDSGPSNTTFVHDDNGKIYRYEPEDGEFYLVLDYTKQVFESWIVEKLCGFSNDSAIVTVLEVHEYYRVVQFNIIDGGNSGEITIIEGGGAIFGWPLLFQLFGTPACGLLTLCYEDPNAGFTYGDGGASCFNATEDPNTPLSLAISLYPNPAQQTVNVSFSQPLSQKTEWLLCDGIGRVLHKESLIPGLEHYMVALPELPSGLYFWSVSAAGARVQGGKLILSK